MVGERVKADRADTVTAPEAARVRMEGRAVAGEAGAVKGRIAKSEKGG
jgi:hypothetical protein